MYVDCDYFKNLFERLFKSLHCAKQVANVVCEFEMKLLCLIITVKTTMCDKNGERLEIYTECVSFDI